MQKLNSAESIRALACLAVVFSHLSLSFFPNLHHFDEHVQVATPISDWIHHSPFSFWFSGTAAVYIFFVLSGYILSFAIYRHADPAQRQNKIIHMFYKRYPRLAIPVLGSCLLTWLIFGFIQVDPQHVHPWLAEYLGQSVGFRQALYEGTIGAFLFGESSVNWVLWTMQIELLGSLLLFALLWIKQKQSSLFVLALMLLLPIVWLLWNETVFWGISCFLVGMCIYLYAKPLSLRWAIPMVLLGLYLAGIHDNSAAYQWLLPLGGERRYELGNIMAGILLVYSILMNAELSRALDCAALIKVGKWSFSIYVLHLPLMYVIAVPILNRLMAWGWSIDLALISTVLIFLLLLLLIAAIYSRYVDAWAMRLSQVLAQRLHSKTTLRSDLERG